MEVGRPQLIALARLRSHHAPQVLILLRQMVPELLVRVRPIDDAILEARTLWRYRWLRSLPIEREEVRVLAGALVSAAGPRVHVSRRRLLGAWGMEVQFRPVRAVNVERYRVVVGVQCLLFKVWPMSTSSCLERIHDLPRASKVVLVRPSPQVVVSSAILRSRIGYSYPVLLSRPPEILMLVILVKIFGKNLVDVWPDVHHRLLVSHHLSGLGLQVSLGSLLLPVVEVPQQAQPDFVIQILPELLLSFAALEAPDLLVLLEGPQDLALECRRVRSVCLLEAREVAVEPAVEDLAVRGVGHLLGQLVAIDG